MIDDVVGEIVQDKINHDVLMGPGIDPHLYKASQGDVKTLTDADISNAQSKVVQQMKVLSDQGAIDLVSKLTG